MRERIIDANLNRLAEGLRVIEDLCRFGLNDAKVSARLKTFRHDAVRLRRAFSGDLLSARDSIGDVGREEVKEPARRSGLLAILGASFGRVAESLRVLEEMGKLEKGGAAGLAKALRYEAYELEKQVVPRFDRHRMAERLRGLYLVMTGPAVGYETLAEAAIKAGVAAIQLREKNWESGRILAVARTLRAMTRDTKTLLIVNDRPDLARLCEADGLHLGQGDPSIAEAREIVGERMLIGKSTHQLRQLKAALAEGPDYVGIGPVFPTGSKAVPDAVLGLEKAGRMLAQTQGKVPAVAIGGITEERLPEVLALGFRCYALISHVGAAQNPLAVIRRLKKIEKSALK